MSIGPLQKILREFTIVLMDHILDDIPPPPPNGKNFKKPRKSNSLSAQYSKHDPEAKKGMVLSEKQRQFALYVGRGMTQHAAAKAVGLSLIHI